MDGSVPAPPPSPAPPRDAPLFRHEALEPQRARWLGTVLVVPGIPGMLLALGSLLLAAAVMGLLFGADYTRKTRVTGWLAPEEGLVRVFAPRQGVIVRLHVREGQAVQAGEPLLTLSTEVRSEEIGAVGAHVLARLRSQIASLAETRRLDAALAEREAEELAGRVATLAREIEATQREAEVQRARAELAQRALARQQSLRGQGLQTEQRLERAEEEGLEQAARLHGLERREAGLDRERAQAAAALAALPLRRARQDAEADRAIAVLEAQLAQAAGEREIVLVAPQPGTVTALVTELGGGVAAATPLLGILPEGARLEAQLFAPSHAIGFLQAGQRVRLRYAAYPYQKFGHHEGEIAGVSRSALSPSELPPRLAGLKALQDSGEPLYRITVALAGQSVAAYGRALPLQPGMQFEADILIERRRLIEWAFDPLYTITGRWRS